MRKINVIIVDDQYMARQLFELYIKSSGRYQLAGTASSGHGRPVPCTGCFCRPDSDGYPDA